MSRYSHAAAAGQLDMFAELPKPTAAPTWPGPVPSREQQLAELAEEEAIASAEAEAERGYEGYSAEDENELGELVEPTRITAELDAWQIERKRIADAVRAGRAAGRVCWIRWGQGTKTAPDEMMRFGKPGWVVELVEHAGEVFAREELTMHHCGSGGPHHVLEGAKTLDEAKLATFRKMIGDCARELRGHSWQDAKKKQCQQLANWILEQAPPLLYGVDLAEELAQLRAKYAEREKLRCTAICAGAPSYVTEEGRELSIYSL